MAESQFQHTSVLLDEAVNGLQIREDGIYIDGTFGRGGHSRLILSKLGPQGRLIAIDRDPQAIAAAAQIDDPRFSIIHGPFSGIAGYVNDLELGGQINGVLLDLGVSSRSWTTRNADSPLCVTGRWICGWIRPAGSPLHSG